MLKTPLAILTLVSFLVTGIVGPMPAYAQDYRLPAPGVMVHLSPEFNPPILKGIKVHPDNPFRFDFILDVGDGSKPSPNGRVVNPPLQEESMRLIKYFLASLTIPEKDLWVNLSPYEKDRIIPQSFGLTEMGRDLLAEDYMLKQITASLIYPEDEIGKKFWKRIYEEASKRFGTTNIPVNTFNKVWIVPEKAVVYENAKAGTAYVVESKLKVMLEQDYLSLAKHNVGARHAVPLQNVNQLGSQIVREIVIPELTQEVNNGKNFTQLRQVYNSLILATWYKKKIKDSILEQVYADKNKTAGVQYTSTVIPAKAGIHFKNDVEGLYQEYLKAFKKGVFNYIKEDFDPATQETIPRKYFSGGFDFAQLTEGRFGAFQEIQGSNLIPVDTPTNLAEVNENTILAGTETSKVNNAMIITPSKDLLQKALDSDPAGRIRYFAAKSVINIRERTVRPEEMYYGLLLRQSNSKVLTMTYDNFVLKPLEEQLRHDFNNKELSVRGVALNIGESFREGKLDIIGVGEVLKTGSERRGISANEALKTGFIPQNIEWGMGDRTKQWTLQSPQELREEVSSDRSNQIFPALLVYDKKGSNLLAIYILDFMEQPPNADELLKTAEQGPDLAMKARQAGDNAMLVVPDFLKIIEKVDQKFGKGSVVIYGGLVRDYLLGKKRSSGDIDILIRSINPQLQQEDFDRGDEILKELIRQLGVTRDGYTPTPQDLVNGSVMMGRFTIDYIGLYHARTVFPKQGLEKFIGRIQESINTMWMDSDGQVVDPYGMGRQDLENHIIRFVGSGDESIQEFANQQTILRAIRYQHELGFRLESKTKEIIDHFFTDEQRFPERAKLNTWLQATRWYRQYQQAKAETGKSRDYTAVYGLMDDLIRRAPRAFHMEANEPYSGFRGVEQDKLEKMQKARLENDYEAAIDSFEEFMGYLDRWPKGMEAKVDLMKRKTYSPKNDPLVIGANIRDIFKYAQDPLQAAADLKRIGFGPFLESSGVDLDKILAQRARLDLLEKLSPQQQVDQLLDLKERQLILASVQAMHGQLQAAVGTIRSKRPAIITAQTAQAYLNERVHWGKVIFVKDSKRLNEALNWVAEQFFNRYLGEAVSDVMRDLDNSTEKLWALEGLAATADSAQLTGDRALMETIIYAPTLDLLNVLRNHNLPDSSESIGVYRIPVGFVIVDQKRVSLGQRDAVFYKGRVETVLGPCVLFTILNQDTGEQFVAHVDGNTQLFSTDQDVLNRIKEWKNKKAILAGGQKNVSERDAKKIAQLLSLLGVRPESIERFDLLTQKEGEGLSVATTPVRLEDNTFDLLVEKAGVIKDMPVMDSVRLRQKTPLAIIDAAMYGSQLKKGGIDLTPANMHLQTQNAGEGLKFHMDPAMLKQLQNAPGFVPVIISIQPMTNLRVFLGLADNQSTLKAASL